MPQNNISRAELATDALFAGTDYDGEEENDVQTYIGDLIANLKHLCKRDGIDFDSCLRSAENHFSAESDDEPSRVEPATISVGDTNQGCGGGPAPKLPEPKAHVVLSNADGNVTVELVTLDDIAAHCKVAEIVKAAGRIADPDDEDAMVIDGLRYSIHDSYHEVIAWVDSADIALPV